MPKDIAEKLRDALRESGQSAHALEKATGVPQPTITRFLAGADMKLATASKLAAYLGGELTFPAAPNSKTKGKAK